MNEKRMELEERRKTSGKIKLFYAIWNGVMILAAFKELAYMGIGGIITAIPVLALWNYIPTVYILYAAKVSQMYPGITFGKSICLTSVIYNIAHGYGLKNAIEFQKLWIRCLLIFPVAKEFAEDKRRLELQAAATEASETPKFADL